MINYSSIIRLHLLLCCSLFSGCIITRTPGFYSGYNRLNNEEKQQVVILKDTFPICSLANDYKIYAINAKQLQNCLDKNDTTVIYFWSPNCSGKSCILIDACQHYCSTKDYKLVVIGEYYDLDKMNAQNRNIILPFFSINHQYYKTDYCNKYVKRFIKDLIRNDKVPAEIYFSRYLIFKGNQLIKGTNDLYSN